MRSAWGVALAIAASSCYRESPSRRETPLPLYVEAGAERRTVVRASRGTVAAGSFHSCALDGQRRVWCWGHGIKGQAGPLGDHRLPVKTSIEDALQVAAGEWFTCVLR